MLTCSMRAPRPLAKSLRRPCIDVSQPAVARRLEQGIQWPASVLARFVYARLPHYRGVRTLVVDFTLCRWRLTRDTRGSNLRDTQQLHRPAQFSTRWRLCWTCSNPLGTHSDGGALVNDGILFSTCVSDIRGASVIPLLVPLGLRHWVLQVASQQEYCL